LILLKPSCTPASVAYREMHTWNCMSVPEFAFIGHASDQPQQQDWQD
jgi:hypothetical protein